MRRTIFGIGIAVIVVGGTLFVWYAFFKPVAPLAPLTPITPATSSVLGFPVAGTSVGTPPLGGAPVTVPNPLGGVSALSLGAVSAPSFLSRSPLTELLSGPLGPMTLAADGQSVIIWDPHDSHFWTVTQKGRSQLFSAQDFFSVRSVVFSPDRTQAVLTFPDGAHLAYNFTTKVQVALPNFWQDIHFSPDGTLLIFKSMPRNVEARMLAVSKPDGSDFEDITTLGNNDQNVFPLWSPGSGIVALFTEHQARERDQLYFVGRSAEQYRSVAIPGIGFQPQWSTRGDKLLFQIASSEAGFRPGLWTMDATPDSLGTRKLDLGVQTFVEKCVWNKNDTALYCAVPKSLPEGVALAPNALDALQDYADDFWKVDPQTGIKKLLFSPDISLNATHIAVSADEQYLFFQDRITQTLYSLKIK